MLCLSGVEVWRCGGAKAGGGRPEKARNEIWGGKEEVYRGRPEDAAEWLKGTRGSRKVGWGLYGRLAGLGVCGEVSQHAKMSSRGSL